MFSVVTKINDMDAEVSAVLCSLLLLLFTCYRNSDAVHHITYVEEYTWRRFRMSTGIIIIIIIIIAFINPA